MNTWYNQLQFLISGAAVGTKEKDFDTKKVNMKESVEKESHQAKYEMCLEPIDAENLQNEKFV